MSLTRTVVFKALVILEGQDMRYTAEEQDSLWDALGPSLLETLSDPGSLQHL